MSETEKAKALTLVTSIVAAVVVLFALQNLEALAPSGDRASLEVCAASKGALCVVEPDAASRNAARGVVPAPKEASELGSMLVTAPSLTAQEVRALEARLAHSGVSASTI